MHVKCFSVLGRSLVGLVIAGCVGFGGGVATGQGTHRFAIGERDFLLDGQRLQIRCGEIHFARVPRECWGHRLKLGKAMGLNVVRAYLVWDFHEWEQGKSDRSG
ncbi:MAG: beta-galactosidase [Sedimentisphaerales bacterium]|nr:beta-galactosidase [Sedimentisphaerales bacterium]